MPLWARYAVTVYFGLMMSGSLPTQGWAKSSNPLVPPALVKSTQFAPMKQPYRLGSSDTSVKSPDAQAPQSRREMLR
ncbi:MAG: hypothetical protein ACIAXF_07730 [Phycisphaerales bacterium JB063]